MFGNTLDMPLIFCQLEGRFFIHDHNKLLKEKILNCKFYTFSTLPEKFTRVNACLKKAFKVVETSSSTFGC